MTSEAPRTSRRACAAALAACLWSSSVAAQQINGLAAWTLGNGTNTYDTQSYRNTGLSQNYVLGVDTPFLDRRLMKLNTEGSFRTNALTSGPEREAQRADQRAVGYKLGASMFPQRPFPLTVQATRDIIDESADYPSSAAIRGGVALPAGAIAPAFQTTARTLAANWQLSAGALPRVEVGYTAENLATAGSGYGAAQQHENLHAGVVKQSTRIRNTFRYDRNIIDNQQASAYNQRNLDMDYEFGALLSARTRMNVHTGQRRMSSLFDLPATVIDPAAGAYAVPSRGDNDVRYVISNISFEPVTRFSIDATASLDRQHAAPASTGARLMFLSTRLDAGGGLSLNAAGTYGDREEIVGDRAVKVVTQSGEAGAAFRTGPHWLEGSVAYNAGTGLNRTPEGMTGETAAQAGQATLSSTIGWVSVSAGEDRSITRDDILDYGNTDVVRDRASLDLHPWRLSIGGSWEDSAINRGRGATFARLRQRAGNAAASVRVMRGWTITANAGTFNNVGLSGTDMTQFWGGHVEGEPSRGLRLSGWIRQETATATQTGLDQRTLAWLALADYQLRDFTVGLEYRNNFQDLRSTPLLDRYRFKGHQVQLRIARKLSFAL